MRPRFPELPIKEQAGYENGCEYIRHETDNQSDSEALDGAGTKQEQAAAGDDRGDVSIQNGEERTAEPSVYCRERGFARMKFLADALKDKHVGINCHSDGKNEPGDSR